MLSIRLTWCRKSTTKQRPRSYRVMLHNDDFNRREYVVKVLLKVLDNFTMEDAINCMQVSMRTSSEMPLVSIADSHVYF